MAWLLECVDDAAALPDNAHVVKIAGKGNLPSTMATADMSEFVNPLRAKEILSGQFEAAKQMNMALARYTEVVRDHLSQIRKDVVIVFDGDNLQENSPFTKLIAALAHEYPVYAFKKRGKISDNFVHSWRDSPIRVVTHDPAEESTMITDSACQTYIAFGSCIFHEQPQKVTEVVDGKDKNGREQIGEPRHGVVVPTGLKQFRAVEERRSPVAAELFHLDGSKMKRIEEGLTGLAILTLAIA